MHVLIVGKEVLKRKERERKKDKEEACTKGRKKKYLTKVGHKHTKCGCVHINQMQK